MPSRREFVHRGMVEGFYGRPYDQAQRAWWIDRLAEWGMNVYVLAPKDDRLGRREWRMPYGAEAMDDFRALIARGDERGVRVGFAVSPGLSIEYSSQRDVETLVAKLDAFVTIGSRFLCLALDDVSSRLVHDADRERFDSLADAHVELTRTLRAALPEQVTLWLVPTDYAGTDVSPYLQTLGRGLPPDVEVAWSGRSVVSPEIRCAEAAARASALGRRLLVWDNVPVNDGPMRTSLHLGPYTNRDPDLAQHVNGLLLNPMEQPRASAVMIRTAADYMGAPERYDPEAAWRRAVYALGVGAGEAFELFASAHRFTAMTPDVRDPEVESAFERVRAAFETDDASLRLESLAVMRLLIERRLRAADTLRAALVDGALVEEIEPWLLSHASETAAMAEALDLLDVLACDAPGMASALAFFRMEGRLTRLSTNRRSSYGPRRAILPQLASFDDDSAHFGRDPVLFVDRCLAEEVVRFAEARALVRLGAPDEAS
jgi:hyaluronoglucosaminidase